MNFYQRYQNWLHTRWPSGLVERMPEVNEDGSTNVPGLYVVGDLSGVPLLKFAADTGARVVHRILEEEAFAQRTETDGVQDVVIIGGGVSGVAAMLEAKKAGLQATLLEAGEAFNTLKNFPKAKPIYTYPTDMKPAGELQFSERSDSKEGLIEELSEQVAAAGIVPVKARVESVQRKGGIFQLAIPDGFAVKAHRVIVAIGRSGNFRKLGVQGEELPKVMNRLHDPNDYGEQEVLVVGGGDSALEAAIALCKAGAKTTLAYRKPSFSRPKPENVEQLKALQDAGKLTLRMAASAMYISEAAVRLKTPQGEETLANEVVFALIGREPPLDFFRRSGVKISGEWGLKTWLSFVGFMLFCTAMYHWKSGGSWLYTTFSDNHWFPFSIRGGDATSIWGSIKNASRDPGFYYSLVYCACVLGFGLRRIKRRNTPYVTRQTVTLMLIQVIPLFFIPYILLPWMGANGAFDAGFGKWFGDIFFPGASYWRSFGFILAWPLFIWNVFTPEPVWGWLILSMIQTFVIIPLIVRRWGKGAYCGWICSCGALAETLGDAHRHKMPHGPRWNKFNMLGQWILATALLLLLLRVWTWVVPHGNLAGIYDGLLSKWPVLNYKYIVDLWIAGIIGVGCYFHFSGRVWCRFGCPLAALMHIYARFSQFRIIPDKKKCISCNVCTSVCHQGIDIMNFANKGLMMEDPECVRCSACVQRCPTGVLEFGRIDLKTGMEISRDSIRAKGQGL